MRARTWLGLSVLGGAGIGIARMVNKRDRIPRTWSLALPAGDGTAGRGPGSLHFIGTATTIIRHAGFTILTDPNFLHRGEQIHIGYGLHATRRTDPAMNFEELPQIDFVVLSHLHEDHFDRFVEQKLDRAIPILTTPHAARILGRKGFEKTYPLDTWDSIEITKGADSVKLTAMPGTHGPLLVASLLPSVMGSMLDFKSGGGETGFRLYVSGDTLIHNDLYEIPKRYPNVDLALLHLGGTRVFGILLTMDGEQGVQAIRIIAPKLSIPIHFNDYDVFKSPLGDFMKAVSEAGLQDRVHYLSHGDTFSFTAEVARGWPDNARSQRRRHAS